MMSEFIMENESQKKLSPAFEQRALASGQNSGFTSCISLLALGELASAGDGSQQLSRHQEERARESLEHQPDRRAKAAHVARAPALLCGGPSCGESSPSSAVPGANPGGGRPTRGPRSQCPEVGAGAGPPEDDRGGG